MSDAEPGLPPEVGGGKKSRGNLLRELRIGLRGAIVDNAALKFVALILSITLFILVNTDKAQVITVSVPISYTMPEDRVLVNEPPSRVRLTVQGPWRRIKRFDERDLEPIHVDLTSMRSGDLTLQDDMVKLPPGLELLSISPPVLELDFDDRQEKDVPVHVARAGRPARGYKVESVTAHPPEVTIGGARRVVEDVTAVRTREVSIDGRRESFAETVSLLEPEEYVRVIGDKQVEVTVTLEEEQTTRTFTVPVRTRPATVAVPRSAAEQLITEPAEVTVVLQGPLLALEQIEADDVRPYVEVFQDDLSQFEPRPALVAVDLPEGDTLHYNINPSRVTLRKK